MVAVIILFCCIVLYCAYIILKHHTDEVEKKYPQAYQEFVDVNGLKFTSYNYVISIAKIGLRSNKKWSQEEDAIVERKREYTKRLQEEVINIERKYPLAYKEFINKKHIPKNTTDNSYLEKITQKDSCLWRTEEEEQRRREEIKIQYNAISQQYSNGVSKWLKEHPHYDDSLLITKGTVLNNLSLIKEYDECVKEAFLYDQWEKEQGVFTDKCLSVGKECLSSFGWYYYNVSFDKKNQDGKLVSGKYKVWQFFAGSYCLEEDLDYTEFEYIKENTNNLSEFKDCNRYYLDSIYEKIQKFILELNKVYDLSVYLCANNKDWSAESLDYHYDKSSFNEINKVVEICNPATDALNNEEDLVYDNYPILKNRHIVIIEMQTENNHLKEVCKRIIEQNKNKKPLITYISLLKGYDREEMSKIIEDKKREKAAEAEKKRKEFEERLRKLAEEALKKEEEERKRKELEEQKKKAAELERKKQIINLLHSNGIKCFYHFTAEANLSSIKRNGGLYSWWSLKQKGVKIPYPGGDSTSWGLDMRYGLQDYVRLSFCDDHPMAYRHQKNGVQLVLLEIDIEVATFPDTLFSDRNAADSGHNHGAGINYLRKVDFDAVQMHYVRKEDPNFKPHQAEVLVKSFVPLRYIRNIDNPKYLPVYDNNSDNYQTIADILRRNFSL